MAKTREQVIQELDDKIPRHAVETREGGGRMKLSYLSGWYTIDRLNKVLGQGNWGYDTELTKVHESTIDGKTDVAYIAKIRLNFNLPANPSETEKPSYYGTQSFEDVGYGDGRDRSAGKAHESAVKEAVTDGIKRCAKSLGMSLGLALYSKEQENVDDGEEARKADAGARSGSSGVVPGPAPKESAGGNKPVAGAAGEGHGGQTGPGTGRPGSQPAGEKAKETLIGIVRKNSGIVIQQGKSTKDALLAIMQSSYGITKIDDLSVEQLNDLNAKIKEMQNV